MRTFAALSVASIALAFAACSGSAKDSNFDNDGGGGGGGGGGGDNGGGSDASYGGDIGTIGSHSEGGTTTGGCQPNPLNYDVPGNNCDDDDDGTVDNVTVCDMGLAASGDAASFAKALGLCQMADATHWGIVSASYADGFGTTDGQPPNAAQHGILPSFGTVIVPREGSSLGALSTGSAATMDSDQGPQGSNEVDGQFKGFKNGMQSSIDSPLNIAGQNWAPPGYPVATSGCPTLADTTYDAVNVILQIKVPANAQGFSVDFDFWSGEWPEYVCTDYNDAFVAYLSSQAFTGNISKDSNNNPISVNAGFFDRCTPGTGLGCNPATGRPGPVTGTSTCGGGASELAGTGFSNPMNDFCSGGSGDPGVTSTSGGATGWLTSTETLMPGETITIQFIIWDTGDWQWDSSVLLDKWVWAPAPVVPGTTRPPP